MTKNWMIGALVVALAGAGLPDLADAKRLGAGRSSGMQRSMPERTAPTSPTATPAQPGAATQQAAPGAAAAAAPAAAAAGRRSWLGPVAGLAAGLGIAALMSHLGMGAAFGEFLTIALLLLAGFFLVRFLMRRFGSAPRSPALAGAAAGAAGGNNPMALRQSLPLPQATPAAGGFGSASAPQAKPALAPAFVPASFDSEGFARAAKAIFIRLQAANDAGDLDDLRRFTTPEMFAELRLELQERGGQSQQTDVVSVEAEVLDVALEDGRQLVSVRYRGQVREEAGAEPQAFDEIWHLVKPEEEGRGWAIAGIEQAM
jgi:predicted lipid-binding transport protein (Tim44 family)